MDNARKVSGKLTTFDGALEAVSCIDWDKAFQDSKEDTEKKDGTAQYWNKRAGSFGAKPAKGSAFVKYRDDILALIAPHAGMSMLDLGCGPGTLGIPALAAGARVTGLDISSGMLEEFKRRAAEKNVDTQNLTLVEGDYDGDWEAYGIEPHDVVVASRSFKADNLYAAIEKLSRFANERVIVTLGIDVPYIEPVLNSVTGNSGLSRYDFIAMLNALFELGYYPTLSYLTGPTPLQWDTKEEAYEWYKNMIIDTYEENKEKLHAALEEHLVVREDGRLGIKGAPEMRWACIEWSVAK